MCLPSVSAVIDAVTQGRPKGPEEKSSLRHVVASLSKAIGVEVSRQEASMYQNRPIVNSRNQLLSCQLAYVSITKCSSLPVACLGSSAYDVGTDGQCGGYRFKWLQTVLETKSKQW